MKNFFLFYVLICTYAHSLLAMDSTNFDQLKERAKIAFTEKNYDEAERCYSQALAVKKCPIVLRNRALTHINTNRLTEAEKDLLESLRLNAQDKVTLYWMGQTKAQLEKRTQAIYYLNKSNDIEPNFKDSKISIEKLKREYQETAKKTIELLSENTVIAKAITKLIVFGRLYNLPNTPKFSQLMLIDKDEKQFYGNALNWFWEKNKYVPLHRGEHPRKLAEFIGGGNRVATVLVQTLPIHLSKKFKDVHVFDTSSGQISFQKKILRAMQTNSIKQFAANAKQSYLDFAEHHERAKYFPKKIMRKWADSEFSDAYQSLENEACPENIHVQEANIFQGLNKALETSKFDVVFLSTIPGDEETDWHNAYRHMRNWLEQGITVVHSIAPLHLLSDSWRDELLLSFEDIASYQVITFDETVGVIHIKLTPRQT